MYHQKNILSKETKLIFSQRFWQAASGVVSVFFLTHYLTSSQQGWYYTFLSLSAIFTLCDIGLSVALLQISAHYSVHLRFLYKGLCEGGNRDNLLALLKKSTFVYLLIALSFCLIMIPVGMYFFESKVDDGLLLGFDWKLPWIFLIISTCFNMLAMPFFSIVEGCGLLKQVYSVRLIQGIIGSGFTWIVLYFGGGLWATSVVPLIGFFVALAWILTMQPLLVRDSLAVNCQGLDWFEEVWPLQWRVGLTWISAFLLTQIYTPIIFHYQGSLLAGQLGLSLTIANMLGLLSQSWVAHRIPLMAQSVALKNWHSFDKIFKQDFFASSAIYILGSLVLFYLYYLLSSTIFINRVLPFLPLAGLFFIVFLNHVIGALSAQLRSYKKEPLVWTSLAGTILTVPIAIFSARYYSVTGVVLAVLIIQLIFTLPLSIRLWFKYNKAWRM